MTKDAPGWGVLISVRTPRTLELKQHMHQKVQEEIGSFITYLRNEVGQSAKVKKDVAASLKKAVEDC